MPKPSIVEGDNGNIPAHIWFETLKRRQKMHDTRMRRKWLTVRRIANWMWVALMIAIFTPVMIALLVAGFGMSVAAIVKLVQLIMALWG